MKAERWDLHTEAASSLEEDSHKSKQRAQELGQEKSPQTSRFTPNKRYLLA